MSKTNYAGIDYGRGTTNIDDETGIRYGVLPANDVEYWNEASEPNYGKPTCGKCGSPVVEFNEDKHGEYEYSKNSCTDYACENCHEALGSDEAFPDQPHSFYIDNEEISAEQSGDDTDIFIFKSLYYTRAQFCSPCAPGAGYLRNPCPTGPKTYCFGPDWFTSLAIFPGEYERPCPYPVWEVATNNLVYCPPEMTAEVYGRCRWIGFRRLCRKGR